MVYEFPIKKLERIQDGLGYYAFLGDGLENSTNQRIFIEAAYCENCLFLKKNGIPEKFPEIKKAENLYNEGRTYEANNTLHQFRNELNFLSSIGKKDIKYFGN